MSKATGEERRPRRGAEPPAARERRGIASQTRPKRHGKEGKSIIGTLSLKPALPDRPDTNLPTTSVRASFSLASPRRVVAAAFLIFLCTAALGGRTALASG